MKAKFLFLLRITRQSLYQNHFEHQEAFRMPKSKEREWKIPAFQYRLHHSNLAESSTRGLIHATVSCQHDFYTIILLIDS